METVQPQPHESDVRDHPAPPGPDHSDAMSLDNHVNGMGPPRDPEPEFAPVSTSEVDRDYQTIDAVSTISPKPAPSILREMPPSEPLIPPIAEPPVEVVAEPVAEAVVEAVVERPETGESEALPATTIVTESVTQAEPEVPAPASLVEPVQESTPSVPQLPDSALENSITETTTTVVEPAVAAPAVEDDEMMATTTRVETTETAPDGTVLTTQTEETRVDTPQEDIPMQSSETSISQSQPVTQETTVTSVEATPAAALPPPPEPILDQEMEDVAPTTVKVAREREEDEIDEPTAKRTKTEDQPSPPADAAAAEAGEPEPIKLALNTEAISSVPPATDTITSAAAPESAAPDSATTANTGAEFREMDWGPMTEAQTKALKQVMQNLKKGKHSVNFQKPVDPVALNIPSYPDIVKNPMDLSTMEQKLKDGKYNKVNEFIADLDLIVSNSILFNGPTHAVSLAAKNLEAHLNGGLRRVPKAGEPAQAQGKKQRKSSFALPQRDTKRRESRPSLGSAQSPSSAVSPTFGLGPDGVPLTRRTSTAGDGRPKREIHKPPSKDLPYASAKPKKKKYQMELKFCEHILGELKKGRFAHLMAPFAEPVDPVALNIPDYHKHVKKPMDFRTISEKVQNGHYENAKEFENDVRLIFVNCYKFNGESHPISQLGKQLEVYFDDMWADKNAWISQNAPASAPQSPEAESGSEEEEEEEEGAEEEDARQKEIAALQEKIAELSAQAMALTGSGAPSKPQQKPAKKKQQQQQPKAAKGPPPKPSRKSSSVGGGNAKSAPPEKKSKPKPAKKYLTIKEKEEIAERIGELSVEDTGRAAELIKAGLRKIGRSDLADRPDEELEFDIAQIPEDTLQALLKLVRKNDPPAPLPEQRASMVGKSTPTTKKKNKPMNKYEQDDTISRLQEVKKSFEQAASGGMPTAQNNAESSDDDDSGSESEEE